MKWTQITTQLHADSPSKYLSLLPFRQASKCYNISNIVVFVCLYRKLVGMLKRKENLTHSLTYLCSATYSINGKNSRFYPNTSTSANSNVRFVCVRTNGAEFCSFRCAKIEQPPNKEKYCLASVICEAFVTSVPFSFSVTSRCFFFQTENKEKWLGSLGD